VNGAQSFYYVRYDPLEVYELGKIVNGVGTSLARDNNATGKSGWLRMTVQWYENGDIVAKLYDAGGNLVSTLSANDTTYTSGGVGMVVAQGTSNSPDIRFDDLLVRKLTGTRISPQLNLSPAGQVKGSLVEWEAKEVMLDFDGVDDHVVVPEPSECIPGGHSYTIEFWAKVHPDNQSWSIPLEWPGGDRIYVGFLEGRGWRHMNTTDGIRRDTGYVLMDGKNKWVFVQAVLNRDTQEQIIRAFDGTWHSNTIDASPGETNPSGNLYIPSHAFPHHGLLMEMRFWHKVRSQSDAENDMYKQLSGHETSLVGYWPMDEGSGSTVYDKSGNENHGTIHGASWTPTDIKIETHHSLDGGLNWSDWAECTNGEPIPGLPYGTVVSTGLLECRQTLLTEDTKVTPELHSLSITVTGAQNTFFMFPF